VNTMMSACSFVLATTSIIRPQLCLILATLAGKEFPGYRDVSFGAVNGLAAFGESTSKRTHVHFIQ
jgi:hypothetical protein